MRVPYPLTMAQEPPAALHAAASPLEDEVVGWFDQMRAPLLRYLSTLGLPVAEGEEIVQEVFLSLFQHLQRGGGRSNLRGWLFRVAHNQGLKRRYRKVRTSATTPTAADPSPSPEEQFLFGEAQRRLQAVVHALPEQDRRCLTLRAEGLRYREIAEVLEMSLGAVSLSLSRSLARIACVVER